MKKLFGNTLSKFLKALRPGGETREVGDEDPELGRIIAVFKLEDQEPTKEGHTPFSRKGLVYTKNGQLFLAVLGYGDHNSPDGKGTIVGLEVNERRLRLVMWRDINEEDNEVIDFESAREDNREE